MNFLVYDEKSYAFWCTNCQHATGGQHAKPPQSKLSPLRVPTVTLEALSKCREQSYELLRLPTGRYHAFKSAAGEASKVMKSMIALEVFEREGIVLFLFVQ